MGSPTLGLRVGAVFILFFVSALGCLTPYLFIQGRKRQERRKAEKQQQGEQALAQQEAAEQGKNGHGHGHAHGDETKHKHHHHLEAFHTTRSMHLLKAFSAGIVISVGFVHVLAEAQERLAEVTEYPVAPFISMIGCITVLALSQVVEGIVTSRRIARRQAALAAAKEAKEEAKKAALAEQAGTAASSTASTGAGNRDGVLAVSIGVGAGKGGEPGTIEMVGGGVGNEENGNGNGNGEGQQPLESLKEHQRQLVERLSLAKLSVQHEEEASGAQQQKQSGVHYDEVALAAMEAGRVPLSEASSLNTPRNKSRSNSLTFLESPRNLPLTPSGRSHNYHRSASARRRDLMERRSSSFQLFHSHGGHHDAEHIVYSFKKESLIVAYLMEIGIVFHSVLIGIGLGVIQSAVAEVKTLLVAICVHQYFEGAGLSTCVLEAQLGRKKNFLMFGLFSITTSLGVCIGIALASIYDPESKAAAILEGCFNSFASGLLICLALVDMMAEEFHRAQVKKDRLLQAQMFACIFLGAGVMSVLAIWA